jgi:hypothetical protein
MKRAALAVLLLSFAGAMSVVPAFGDSVLDDNNFLASSRSFGDVGYGGEISNWFTLTSNATIKGAIFDVWVDPGASLESIGWSIGTTPYSSGAGGLPAVTLYLPPCLQPVRQGTTI